MKQFLFSPEVTTMPKQFTTPKFNFYAGTSDLVALVLMSDEDKSTSTKTS